MRKMGLALLALLVAGPVAAQEPYAPAALTEEDYARAERFLPANTAPLVFGANVRPVWLEDDRFWYLNTIPEGREFVLVDPARRTRERAFDHERLANAIAEATGKTVKAFDLPFHTFEFVDDGRAIAFEVDGTRYRCDLTAYRCAEAPAVARAGRNEVVSPDGRLAAFIRDHNLWVRNLETGEETQLTTDGVEDFGYATNNAGWMHIDRPVLLWSPDSRRIATFQQDARGVGEMYLATTNVGHPTLERWKYPLPGDSLIFRLHRVVIHLDAPADRRVVRLQMPPDPQRSTICDHIYCNGTFSDVQWSDDGERLFFVSVSRDHKHVVLREANPVTGAVRDILEETEENFFNLNYRAWNWVVLPRRNEVLWYSQRDDWAHLYRYDLRNGKLKGRVTKGDWNVLEVLRVDEESGTITFIGNGREKGDPYFEHLYTVRLDGKGLKRLTPDSAHHQVSLSPSGRYVVISASTPTTPPVTVLRDLSGREVLILERADISRLVEAGWQPPIPITVKARDGKTDLYGLMFRPTRFDASKKYPIINNIYPGPQTGSVRGRHFQASRADAQALAELGFIVVQIDTMGTPRRSKSFHEAYYGNLGDNGLPDQIAGMKQLAERHPWIDLDRAGIYGHSGGGFASTRAILAYPDFFKVAVSQAGNHDNRNYADEWGEEWHGLLERYPDGTTNYDSQANQLLAGNLKGKLLLAHGTLDDNVPHYNTLLVVNALIEANKDFDLIMFPNRRHGFGNEPYMMRRRWDYFVEHLLGATPPKEYRIGAGQPTS